MKAERAKPPSGGGGAGNPFASLMSQENLMKIMQTPEGMKLMSDPGFQQKMQLIQSNPQMLMGMMNDPQVSQFMNLLLGQMMGPGGMPGGMGGMGPQGGNPTDNVFTGDADDDDKMDDDNFFANPKSTETKKRAKGRA